MLLLVCRLIYWLVGLLTLFLGVLGFMPVCLVNLYLRLRRVLGVAVMAGHLLEGSHSSTVTCWQCRLLLLLFLEILLVM